MFVFILLSFIKKILLEIIYIKKEELGLEHTQNSRNKYGPVYYRACSALKLLRNTTEVRSLFKKIYKAAGLPMVGSRTPTRTKKFKTYSVENPKSMLFLF
jgi:hypothetical protein